MSLIDIYDGIYSANGNAWPDFEDLIGQVADGMVDLGDTAVDGGANLGDYTVKLLSRVGRIGKVFAFEPLPHIFAELQKRLTTVELSQRVFAHEAALANFMGRSTFVSVPELPGYSGLLQRDYPWQARTETIEVRTVTLDSFVSELEGLTFIKLDLEGGEYHALRGAAGSIERYRPFIVFEHGGDATYALYGYTAQDLWDFFQKFDYEFFDVLGNRIEDLKALAYQKVYNYYAVWKNHPRHSRFCEIMDRIRRECITAKIVT